MEVQDAVGVTLQDTQNDSPSLPTLYRDVDWDDVGIVWLNQESMESRAALRSHHGGIVGQDTETYARFLDNQTVEVAVRQIMQELIIREVQMMPTTVSGFNQLRNNAVKRLDLLFKSLVDGTLRPVSSDDSEEE
jgi:glutamyl-tRNA reductase